MEWGRYRQGCHSHVEDGPESGRSGGPQSWIDPTNCYPDTYSGTCTYPFACSYRGARPRCDSCPDRHSSGYCYTCPYRDTGSHGGRSADRHSGAYSYPSTNRDPGADGNPSSNACTHGHASAYGDTGSHRCSGADAHSYPATYSYSSAYPRTNGYTYCHARTYANADSSTSFEADSVHYWIQDIHRQY